jgi:cysteine-rich repeat protein
MSSKTLLFFLAVMAFGCSEKTGSSHVTSPAMDTSAAFPVPEPSSVDESKMQCDQAADGTSCGDARHCIFGVCADNLCGDGVRAGQESCDDGNDRDGDGCPSTCQYPGVCRDGEVDEGEECDDGNRVNDDSCSNSCLKVACGNRRIDPGEECDDGNRADGDECSSTCQLIQCGNGRVDPGERCDKLSGCTVKGEACSSDCGRCERDACGACAESKCSSYMDIDVFGGCRKKPDAQVGDRPIAGYVEKCSALDDCIRQNPSCATDEFGILRCYCGDLPFETCQITDRTSGACAALFPAATACDVGEGVSNCIFDKVTDGTLPAAFAQFLAVCRIQLCAAECGY